MSEKTFPFLIDYNDTETDDTCGMALWWSTLEGGRGILRKSQLISKLMLEETQNDLRTIATMPDISAAALQKAVDEILAPLTEEDKDNVEYMELLYRRLGWMVAFALYVEPSIRLAYNTIPIDSDIVLDREPLWVIAHPGRILEAKHSPRTLIYEEYLPYKAGLSTKFWAESWKYTMRLHVGIAAATETLNKGVAMAQVRGLSEGYHSLIDGRLNHPYVYAWYNETVNMWSASRPNGKEGTWTRRPVWEYEGGLVGWVQLLGMGEADRQFPLSLPVHLNEKKLEGWVGARLNRERQINGNSDECHKNIQLRQVHFKRVTNHCRPKEGPACPYLECCWDMGVGNMPLKSGIYIPTLTNSELKLGVLES